MNSNYWVSPGFRFWFFLLGLLVPSTPLWAYQVGPEFKVGNPVPPYEANQYLPAIAANYFANEYLVVWHEKIPTSNRYLVGQRVSMDGVPIGPQILIQPESMGHDRFQPSVSFDFYNQRYLVVWMYDADGSGNNYEIWGKYLQPDGSQPDPQFKIISWPNRSFWSPKVYINKFYQNQLVVWNALDTQTQQFSDIAGALVSGNGLVTPIPLITTEGSPHQVSLTYCNECAKFMVVWRRMHSPADGDIYGAFLHQANGAVMDPPGVFVINNDTVDQNFPSVASDDKSRFVVVWQNAFSGTDQDVIGQYIDSQGSKLGGTFSLGTSSENETNPQVAGFGWITYKALAVWQRETAAGKAIWASIWDFGEIHPKPFEVASYPFWDNETPSANLENYRMWSLVPVPVPLIVYASDSIGDPTIYRNIYGRILQFSQVYMPLLLKN